LNIMAATQRSVPDFECPMNITLYLQLFSRSMTCGQSQTTKSPPSSTMKGLCTHLIMAAVSTTGFEHKPIERLFMVMVGGHRAATLPAASVFFVVRAPTQCTNELPRETADSPETPTRRRTTSSSTSSARTHSNRSIIIRCAHETHFHHVLFLDPPPYSANPSKGRRSVLTVQGSGWIAYDKTQIGRHCQCRIGA